MDAKPFADLLEAAHAANHTRRALDAAIEAAAPLVAQADAAGELVEALQEIAESLFEAGDDFDRILCSRWDAIDKARAALAKAKAVQP